MSDRDRTWLRGFLHLGARAIADGIPTRDIERQEDTVLRALSLLGGQPGVVLADEVGMGKTFEALGVIAAFRHTDPKSRIVVLTPGPDLNTKWEKEFTRFSEGRDPIYSFGADVRAVRTVSDFVAAVREKHIVVAPVTLFNSVRGGSDQAYLLSLFFHWKEMHGHTANAILKRFRGGKLSRVDVTQEKFLGVASLEQVEPHLSAAFRASGEDEGEGGLDSLFETEKAAVFEREDLIRRALDRARFRLVRALIPSIDLLVLDEAHKLKNADTVRSVAVRTTFRRKFKKALFLTATPFQLDIGELGQVFALFSIAKGAPADTMKRAESLFADIRDYQRAYDIFQQAWLRIDPGTAAEFGDLYTRDPELRQPVDDPSLRVVVNAVRDLLRLKRETIEPGFRAWMIRSIREDKRVYREHTRHKKLPEGPSVLPFLVYERFIAELFRRQARTHKAAVEINMVSSYGAARTGALLADEVRENLPKEAEGYRKLLRNILDELRERPAAHPKLGFVLEDALNAAENGEKTLVFCARVETLSELAREITRAFEARLLARWRRVYPGAARDEMFSDNGRHERLRSRFHNPQDALYLALRERYIQSLLSLGDWADENLNAIVTSANERLSTLRTGKRSAERLDYRLLKRCVEQATAALWRTACPSDSAAYGNALDALTSPEFLTLGLDLTLDDLENDEAGRETPEWSISAEGAALATQHRPHLWGYLSSELEGLDFDVRVQVVERLARFLTYREVPFLADLLASARDAGLDVESIESRALLAFTDSFWSTSAGRRWIERLKSFLGYFRTRDRSQQRDILDGPIKTIKLVRQTRDGESRERLREAFNTPLYPMILIANEVMQEGLDLHRNCRRVVHHDLAWNPAQLEQRVGRVDRLGSLTHKLFEKNPLAKLDVLYPLVHRTIDERLYRTVKSREKWLEFLLGAQPDFGEYTLGDEEPPELPEKLAMELRLDLSPAGKSNVSDRELRLIPLARPRG
ncbi:MAG: DEAD/DEAH box helicase family protein [Polyangiaceae bacterium]|nr:DEAD/DEAH box helicase family protein [Polyangiaceae bacterium]